MFHVKLEFLKKQLKKITVTLMLTIVSQFMYSQKEKDFSIGLGSDLSFGGGYNNFATSIKVTYNILDKIRIVPAYSYYIKKEMQNMYTISFDFNYLPQNISTKIFPKLKEGILVIYPIAGFFIINYSKKWNVCNTCSIEMNNPGSSYDSKFGFDFGVGAEYKIPSKVIFLKKSRVFFETKYITIEKFYRPLISCGLFYKL